MILSALIGIFAWAGLLNALYFTLAYYGRVKKSRWVPQVLCAREGSSCAAVVRTPFARAFGLPNSLLGVIYYLVLLAWVLAGGGNPLFAAGDPRLYGATWLVLGASAAAALFGFYLMHALWRVLRVRCPLCYAAHAINAALLILLAAVAW